MEERTDGGDLKPTRTKRDHRHNKTKQRGKPRRSHFFRFARHHRESPRNLEMRAWALGRRQFSTSVLRRATESEKRFSKTLLLPKTAFPQWCDPQKSELPFRAKTSEKLYKWQVSFTYLYSMSSYSHSIIGIKCARPIIRPARWTALR